MAFVYILQSLIDHSYYIGSTNSDVNTRLAHHNAGYGSQYTNTKKPWKLIYYKTLATEALARKEEKRIKSYKGGNAFKRIIRGEMAEWSKAAPC